MKTQSSLPVLFIDLDDTMVNSTLGYDQAMRAIGLEPNDAEYLLARQQTKKLLPKGAPQHHSRFLYFKTYLENKNSYSPALHLEMAVGYETALCGILKNQWEVLNRTQLFLDLRQKFSLIHIITNEITRIQALKLQAFDPEFKLFDRVTTSEDIGFEKPHLSIFQYALSLAKVDPSQVVMVGDSEENDIRPAIALGMRPILTTEFKKHQPFQGNYSVIERLDELLSSI